MADLSPQFPLHPKHRLAMPRNWSAEPEERMTSHMLYRRTKYGQGQPAPQARMIRNMRRQEEFRRS